jgi:hypothetical protein
MRRNCNPYALVLRMYNGTSAIENGMVIPEKIKIQLLYYPPKE